MLCVPCMKVEDQADGKTFQCALDMAIAFVKPSVYSYHENEKETTHFR